MQYSIYLNKNNIEFQTIDNVETFERAMVIGSEYSNKYKVSIYEKDKNENKEIVSFRSIK